MHKWIRTNAWNLGALMQTAWVSLAFLRSYFCTIMLLKNSTNDVSNSAGELSVLNTIILLINLLNMDAGMDPWRWLQQLTPQLYHAICKGQIFPPSAHLVLFHCLLACCSNRQSVDICSIQQLPPCLLSLREHNDSWQDDDDDTVRTNDDTMTKTWGHKEDMTTTWWWRHPEKSHHTKEVDPKKPTLMAEVKYIKRGKNLTQRNISAFENWWISRTVTEKQNHICSGVQLKSESCMF